MSDHTDRTGKHKIISNVLTSWASYSIFIISGFLTPRLISDGYGINALGTWDFAWSLVAYYGLLQLGINTSVIRYVSKYYPIHDYDSINKVASTIWLFQIIISILTIAATYFLYVNLEHFYASEDEALLKDAQLLFIAIGFSISFSIAFAPYTGIINATHNWAAHNILTTIIYLVTVLGMYTCILLGYPIFTLGVVYLLFELINQIIRIYLAHKYLPQLNISPLLFNMKTFLETSAYGVKNIIPKLSDIVSMQTVNIVIASIMGPAALAIFARPVAISRHFQTLLSKFSNVFLPTITALDSKGETANREAIVNKFIRYNNVFSITFLIGMLIIGDIFIRYWMGELYVNYTLIAFIALSMTLKQLLEPIWVISMSMNRHGRLAIIKITSALISLAVIFMVANGTNVTVATFSIIIFVVMAVVELPLFLMLSNNAADVNFIKYMRVGMLLPIIDIYPVIVFSILLRLLYEYNYIQDFSLVILFATIVSIVYWKKIVPLGIKNRINKYLVARI